MLMCDDTNRSDESNAGIEDRTTALGLFNYAQSYWRAAARLRNLKTGASHPDAPILFLYAHAIELFLKAYLRGDGVSVENLRGKYSHDLRKLTKATSKAMRGKGIQLDPEDLAVFRFLAQSGIINFRYIETGCFSRPSFDALEGACRGVNDLVSRRMQELGHKVRWFDVSAGKLRSD